jgi:hypothetical protein
VIFVLGRYLIDMLACNEPIDLSPSSQFGNTSLVVAKASCLFSIYSHYLFLESLIIEAS